MIVLCDVSQHHHQL
jgi:hypothetical protein